MNTAFFTITLNCFCGSQELESLSLNALIPIKGTPLEKQKALSPLEMVRVIAACRILMPKAFIRLSAGRNKMSETEQFLCFYSGANSIFIGEKLLTAKNSKIKKDQQMFKNMGLQFKKTSEEIRRF